MGHDSGTQVTYGQHGADHLVRRHGTVACAGAGALLTGWKRWLLVAGAVHASFTDLALLAEQSGIDIGAGLSGARSLDITRAYVRAFFDLHLRGTPQTLLDRPSPSYPEVTFAFPEPDPRA